MSFFWVGHFEFFFRKKKKKNCFIPMKISPNLHGRMERLKFWCVPWFPENSLLCVILRYIVYIWKFLRKIIQKWPQCQIRQKWPTNTRRGAFIDIPCQRTQSPRLRFFSCFNARKLIFPLIIITIMQMIFMKISKQNWFFKPWFAQSLRG